MDSNTNSKLLFGIQAMELIPILNFGIEVPKNTISGN